MAKIETKSGKEEKLSALGCNDIFNEKELYKL